jgi:hypothetical protein
MNGDVDYYAVLRVAKSADEANIRAAYRTLVKRYHPDVAVGNRDQATKVFHLITRAYETLCDESRRAQYDAHRQLATARANGGQDRRHAKAPASGRSENRRRDSAAADGGFARAREVARRRHAGLRNKSRVAFVWFGGLVVAVTAVLFLAEILKFVVAHRASTPTAEPARHSATMVVVPPALLTSTFDNDASRPGGRQPVLSGWAPAPALGQPIENLAAPLPDLRRLEIGIRQSTCVNDEGVRFVIMNQNGEARIAYNSNLLVPASIDYQGRSILILSRTLPDRAVSIVIARGDPDATAVVLSDAHGQAVRTLEARCDGAAY